MTDRLSDERLRQLIESQMEWHSTEFVVVPMARELLELRQEVTEQLEGMNDLDAVVHILGIEDSDVLPAKRISEILGELERARAAASAGPVMPEEPSEAVVQSVFAANGFSPPGEKQAKDFVLRAWIPIRAALAKEQSRAEASGQPQLTAPRE